MSESNATSAADESAYPFGPQPRFPWREELKIRLWAGLATAVLLLFKFSIRKHFIGTAELFARWQRGEQVILTFWHSRIALMRFGYRGKMACIMNSSHRDGEIITRAIRRFGIQAVRGSSSRGWVGGLKGMVAAYRCGYDLIVVPDGPRGPSQRAKPGALQLARQTGAPVYPATYGAAWCRRLANWDRMVVPFPFSRVVYVVGPPIFVPTDATSEQMERKRALLEERLRSITAQADAYFTRP